VNDPLIEPDSRILQCGCEASQDYASDIAE